MQSANEVVSSDRWVDRMGKFATCVVNCVDSLPGHPQLPTVKVAIIDDGIEYGQDHFHVATGFSFWRDDFTHTFKDFWVDSGGHGTRMASFITMICPMASLYIGRLCDLSTVEGKSSFTADSAAKVR